MGGFFKNPQLKNTFIGDNTQLTIKYLTMLCNNRYNNDKYVEKGKVINGVSRERALIS